MAITAILWICIVVALQQTHGQNPEYNVESERYGDVEILYVKNADGELVEVIEEHANQHYQVIKPTDENDHVCLIQQIEQYPKDDDVCYERVPLTPETDEQREDALAKCGDRKVYALEKVDCRVRAKRACAVLMRASSFCVQEESYCVRKGCCWWSGCIQWGKRCAKYEIRETPIVIC